MLDLWNCRSQGLQELYIDKFAPIIWASEIMGSLLKSEWFQDVCTGDLIKRNRQVKNKGASFQTSRIYYGNTLGLSALKNNCSMIY